MSFRVTGPALVWFRRTPLGWDRYIIEKEFLPIEAGGASYDIDGDGDNDIGLETTGKATNSGGGKIHIPTSIPPYRGSAT